MSTARCSSCHCYSRNCPIGLPNHKSVPVGPNCTMNSLGRHFRDQSDTTVPLCDYENCVFFATDDFRSLQYPTDVSLGPAVEPVPSGQSAEVSAIMALLQQQKVDNDSRHQQMLDLQKQVSNLLLNGLPVCSFSPSLITNQPPVYSTPTTTPSSQMFLPPTMPSAVANAAVNLNAALQQRLAMQNNGFPGLIPDTVPLGQQQQHQPVTNPLAGMGVALGVRRNDSSQVINSVDQLYAATITCKQLRAHEFAATAQFPYKSQLNQNNCNAVVFAYGSFKHLEAIKSGLIPNVSDDEFLTRLRHLKNVFEVVCLSSNLATFSDPAWQVAREYDSRIIADIESGVKTWEGLSNGLETDAIYVAKEIVELKNKAKKPSKDKTDKTDVKTEKPKKEPKGNGCTTYNTHRASEGCYWEHLNKGETCVYEHFCSWCKVNRNTVEKHKSLSCEFKTE
jgi:hypothetical protein